MGVGSAESGDGKLQCALSSKKRRFSYLNRVKIC